MDIERLNTSQSAEAAAQSAGNCNRGSALVELAVTLGVLLTLLSGMVDVWKYCQDADLILTASRHGARSSGAMAQQTASTSVLSACDYAGGGAASAVLDAGLVLANQYLVAVGLETTTCTLGSSGTTRTCDSANNQFALSSQFETECEGGFVQRAIRLSIVPKVPRKCILCFGKMFSSAGMSATSVFAAEADCKTYAGAPTC